jgi:lysozyme
MLNESTIKLVKEFEGCKLTAYECATSLSLPASKKFYTIGWGNTTYEDGTKVKKNDTITQDRADKLLHNLLDNFEAQVQKLVRAPLNENQKGAIVSFAYNCGIGNLKASTLLRRLNDGEYEVSNEFLKWNKANGKVLAGLSRRRKAEAELFTKAV